MDVKNLGAALCGFWLIGCTSKAPLRDPLPYAPAVPSTEFRQTMASLTGADWHAGNSIRTLNNGDEIFPAMLAAICSARRSITFETFVFESGEMPGAFAEALQERARAGVKVHVILDGVGAAKSSSYWHSLRKAGVELVIYHSPWWIDPRRHNHRTHRKLLIVDGAVGFIGGVGVADLWKGNASSPEELREQHYQVEGPVVAQLQGIFQDNWMKSRHQLLLGSEYFPRLRAAGPVPASAFGSSPLRGRNTLEIMNHLAIAAARQTIEITNAYFLPDSILVEALCSAARRGVQVRILMPGEHMDQKAVRRQSRKTWRRLLAAGVQLYEYTPTMIHSKLLIVDGLFVSVGSGNLDPRSLRINDEANLNVLDSAFARQQRAIFERDLRHSQPVTLDEKNFLELPWQIIDRPLRSQL